MNRPLKAALIGAVLSSLAAVYAVAQPADTKRPRATLDATEAAEAAAPQPEVAADAPNARLAALIRRDLVISRNKGVQSVRRIARGVYCIRPTAASGIVVPRAIVMLTPEYFFSLQNEITVQWAFNKSGCASNELGVYTFADPSRTGLYQFSNDVSFSIIVP